ncbi:MAG: hypothetical protein J6Y37_09430 [Paludibacteraceae bacterium]|nr:hypothetical protein [Paludibacteraceae bacterium]
MKKILFLAVVLLSLFSCSKEVEMERASYAWVEGDSIPKKSFIMSVSTIYNVDTISTKQKLECQVTFGDSTDKNLIGTKLELDVLLDDGNNGTYTVGSSCEGTIRIIKCRPGVETNVAFFPTVYTLSEGRIDLKNLTSNHDQVLLTVDLTGIVTSTEMQEVTEEDIDEEGETTYNKTLVEREVTKQIHLTGEITALR